MVLAGFVLLAAISGHGQNLLTNPGFESGTQSWDIHGGGSLTAAANAHWGDYAAWVTNRIDPTNGIQQSLAKKLVPGAAYYCAAWAAVDTTNSQSVTLSMVVIDSGGLHQTNLASASATNGCWVFLDGIFYLQSTGLVQDIRFVVSGPGTGISLGVDSAAVVPLSGFRLAAAKFPGVRIGGVGSDSTLANVLDYAATVGTDYHIAGPENALKFSGTEPGSNTYTFGPGDAIMSYARANGQQARGHTLIWHSAIPNWVTNNSYTTNQLQTIAYDHVDTVAGHYKGQVFCWDVVNEALNTDGSMRSTVWYNQPGFGFAGQGSNYIAALFNRARAADPQAKLVYNDYGTDVVNAKSTAIYAMAQGFKSRGVPIDAIGFQEHLSLSGISIPSWRTNLQRFDDLGMDIHITELDVKVPLNTNTGAADAANLATQGDVYFNLVGTALGFPHTKVIQTWGFSDRYSWIPAFSPGYGAGLPLDENFDRKPAWWALYNVLANQAEKLPVAGMSSGDSQSVATNTLFCAGQARIFSAGANNDYITLAVRIPYAGPWSVRVGVRKDNGSGIYQLAAAPAGSNTYVNIGSTQDLYASSTNYAELTTWTNTFSAAGDWWFRFMCTGKNGSSSGRALALDYIRLTPTGSDGNQPPGVDPIGDQATLKNQTFGPLPFMVHDRETVEPALSVSVASSNPRLFPANNLTLTAYGPQYLFTAQPAPDYYGTATITITVADADGATNQGSFNLTVTNGYHEPVLDPIADQVIAQNTFAVIPFTMWDTLDPVGSLSLSIFSSNTNLLRNPEILVTGTGTNRSLTLTPMVGRVGSTTITMTLADSGGKTATNVFSLQVAPPSLAGTQELANVDFEAPFNTLSTVTSSNSITGQLSTGWYENSSYSPYWPTMVYAAETNDVPSGSYAQEMTLFPGGAPNFQLTQPFNMTNNRIYTASIWMKSQGMTGVTLSMNRNSSPYNSYYSTNVTLTNYWTQLVLTGNGVTNIQCRFQLRSLQPGTIWMDQGSVVSQPTNTAPILAAVSNLTIVAGQVLLVTNTATDAGVPPQVLTYSLLSAPTNASVTGSNGIFQWRPGAAQAGTTNNIAIKVADNGLPILSATQAFTVLVSRLTKPALNSFKMTNGFFRFNVTGDASLDYIVQRSADLAQWTNIATNLSVLGSFDWVETNTPLYSNKFYRIMLYP